MCSNAVQVDRQDPHVGADVVQASSRSGELTVRFLPSAVRPPPTILCILDPELLDRITTRRAELDELEEQLATQLEAVRAERDELAVAERVLERVSEQLAEERASARPMAGQVGAGGAC